MSKTNEKETLFKSLTPEHLPKSKLDLYYDAFDFALSNSEVKNLAVTGSYGSGKSTLIRSVQNLFTSFNFLNVSLASFNEEELLSKHGSSDKKKGEYLNDLERLLELSILQQIFYHVKPSDIPDSRFKRIKSLSKDDLVFFSLQSVIWIISVMFIFFPNQIPFINHFNNLDVFRLVSFVVFFWGLWYAIIHFRRVYNNSKVNKLNIQSGEFELDKEIEQSILNKNIDEIIYFFQVTKFNVVVFEDLDRFDNKEIFSKLREINLLLNNSTQVGKRILFIYAIRDDLFKDESRTKFFDFIIPVIPYINYSNSKEILGETIEKMSVISKPTEKFIKEISVFIHDMRFLKNVMNEYRVYENKMGSHLDQDKLLAIIFFKNFYPTHFAEIHENNGVLNRIFKQRDRYTSDRISKIKSQIDALEVELEGIEGSRLQDKEVLWKSYVDAIRKHLKHSIGLIIPGVGFIEYSNLYNCTTEVRNSIINSENLEARFIRDINANPLYIHNKKSDISFKDIESLVDPKYSFSERCDMVMESYKEPFYEQIKNLESNIQKIEYDKFSKIIENIDLSEFTVEIEKPKPLIFLLRNGYIDDHFMKYVSYFHPHSLTTEDNDFLESVYSDIQLGFNYPIQNAKNVIETIDIRHFHYKRIFNYYLVSQLIELRESETMKFKVLFGKLTDGSVESYQFNLAYIEHENNPIFIRELVDRWKWFWRFIERDSKLTYQKKSELLFNIIKYGKLESLLKLSKNSNLKKFIEDHKDILNLMDKPKVSDKFIELATSFGIKFSSIDPSISKENSLLKTVYQENLYQLNIHMIKLVLSKFSKNGFDQNSILSYTDIFESGLDKLKTYAKLNINEVLQSLTHSDYIFNENEEALIDILNNETIKEEVLVGYFSNLRSDVENLDRINDKAIKIFLLKNNKIEPNWNNIDNIYSSLESQLTDDLIKYLDDEYISFELSLQTDVEFGRKMSFYGRVVVCNEISFENYTNLIKGLKGSPWNNLDLSELDFEKVEWLVSQKIISLSEENFNHLKENFYPQNIHLLEVYSDELDIILKYDLDFEDFEKIILSNEFNDFKKIKFIDNNQDLITQLDTKILKQIVQILLSTKNSIILSISELHFIFKNLDFDSDFYQIIEFFNLFAVSLEKEAKRNLLELFPEEFSKLLIARKRTEVDRISPFIEFSKILESSDITHRKVKDSTIVLTGKG